MVTTIATIPLTFTYTKRKIDQSAIDPPTLGTRILSRITAIAKACFEFLKSLVLFPLRYFGSKTWSIPGVILRAPIIAFNRLFTRPLETFSQELFHDNGYSFSFDKTLSPDELQPYLPAICGTGFVHKGDQSFIPTGWKAINPKKLNLKIDCMQARDSNFFDPATGLKASLMENGKEVIISFSSLEPGVKEDQAQKFGNGKTGVLLKLYLGGNPPSFDLASKFVKQIKTLPYFRDKKIVLSGNSYGGSLAQYAGLQNSVKAVCSNAVPLSAGQQKTLGQNILRNARLYITHIAVENDYVTDVPIATTIDRVLSAIGIRTAGNFGRRYKIPSAYARWQLFHHHGFTLGSVMNHLGHGYRKIPCTL
jgi:hypothetical protein